MENLEMFTLIVLDSNDRINQYDQDVQRKLRHSINFLKIFTEPTKCGEYIQQITGEKVVLIVSSILGRKILPNIHNLPQLCSIYVIPDNENLQDSFQAYQKNEEWTSQYDKIVKVITDRNDLIANLSEDQVVRNKLDAETPSITIYNSAEKSHTNLNGSFIWSQLFLETLLRMPRTESAKDELIEICTQNNEGNVLELIKLEEFKQTYMPDDAIKWYTKDCCIYRSLNKALRVQNMDLLFAFRLLIIDIFNQLKLEHNRFQHTTGEAIVRCYRGQKIATEEFNRMRSGIGRSVSMNSFLSTTRDRNLALIFAPSANNMEEKVLFEIEVDTNIMQTKPFADVNHLSCFNQEKEILFMCGTIFQIKNINYDETEHFWTVELTLCSEKNSEFSELFDYLKQRMVKTTDFISIGKLLREMGKFDQARKYYQRSLCELPFNDRNISVCYYGLGIVYDREGNYKVALDNFEKALEFQLNILTSKDTVFIGKIYGSIGTVYYNTQNYDLALKNLEKSLNILLETIGLDDIYTAMVYTNIGRTYQSQKKYDLSLENHTKALAIKLKILPPKHPRMARSYLFIGNVYADKQEYTLSLIHYKKALEIQQKSLPENATDIGVTLHRIGQVHANKNEYQTALENYLKAHHVYQLSLPSGHEHVVLLENDLKSIKDKLK